MSSEKQFASTKGSNCAFPGYDIAAAGGIDTAVCTGFLDLAFGEPKKFQKPHKWVWYEAPTTNFNREKVASPTVRATLQD